MSENLSENMSETSSEYQRNKIYDMLLQLNDDTLVKPNESPNGNTITHIYNDGNITSQKGGWAYEDRSEFNLVSSITTKMNLDINKFNHKRIVEYNNCGRVSKITYGYIIVTFENALLIRDEMEKLEKLIKGGN
jgi:hypothetical protein